jgi:hypothetical protein
VRDRIAVLVHDLSSNPIIRAVPFIASLQGRGYKVQVLGILQGREVYAPVSRLFDIDYTPAKSFGIPIVILILAYKLRRFDRVFVFKPLVSTLLPALICRQIFNRKIKIHLDVEDNDLLLNREGKPSNLPIYRGWRSLLSTRYNFWMHRFLDRCDSISVSSHFLKNIYLGEIVLSNPMEGSSADITPRKNKSLNFIYFGDAKSYKGLSTFAYALSKSKALDRSTLRLIGNPFQEEFKKCKSILGNRCEMIGYVEIDSLSDKIKDGMFIPVLQKKNNFTEAQVPAKMLDAMQHGITPIVSNVGDLGYIVEKHTFVWNDKNIKSLIGILDNISELSNEQLESASYESKERYLYLKSKHSVSNYLSKAGL